jgi:hypothetical protein
MKVIEFGRDALQIAAMEKVGVSRIESTLVRISRRRPSTVIGWIAVIEPIWEKKIDDLA